MHPHAIPPNQKGKPWPAYFLVRTTGEVVPLIAVDELPPGTELVGVPRSLDLEDTIGMLNLGLQRGSGAFYQTVGAEGKGKVEGAGKAVKPVAEPPSSAPARTVQQSSTTPNSTPPSTPKVRIPSTSVSQSTNTTTQQIQNQAQPQPHPQTQVCRHWCHHGICKWGQQCRYRHIMPMSTSGLQEVGLIDWPLWFRRMNPGYFVAEAVTLNGGVNSAGRIGGGGRGRRGARVIGCASTEGNGGACCGVLHGPGGAVGGRRERVRGERVVGREGERGAGRVLRSEELGEQIIARLRGMSKEHAAAKEKVVEKVGERLSSSSLVERAAARDTKSWEDESDDDSDVESEGSLDEKEELGKGKLVDV
ncbi:hypothetical protein BKA65DRAFT_460655 [Rhexocercosporidium sp. MPI-PUGE-AT-0058]|nr:hypothetical protein BKA65DRAFT_460655 [Rhexocercosporidium sp. MPI-PUGE-AT-0058]